MDGTALSMHYQFCAKSRQLLSVKLDLTRCPDVTSVPTTPKNDSGIGWHSHAEAAMSDSSPWIDYLRKRTASRGPRATPQPRRAFSISKITAPPSTLPSRAGELRQTSAVLGNRTVSEWTMWR